MRSRVDFANDFLQLCRSRESFLRRLPPIPVLQQQISKSRDERQGRVHHQLRRRLGRRIGETGSRRRFRTRNETGAEAAAEVGSSERWGPRRDDGSHVAGFERWQEVTVGTWSFFLLLKSGFNFNRFVFASKWPCLKKRLLLKSQVGDLVSKRCVLAASFWTLSLSDRLADLIGQSRPIKKARTRKNGRSLMAPIEAICRKDMGFLSSYV